MERKILAVLLILLVCFSLAFVSCDSSKDEKDETEKTATTSDNPSGGGVADSSKTAEPSEAADPSVDGNNSSNGTLDSSTSNAGGEQFAEHKGGTATCTKRAVCEICGKEYGELAPHTEETVTGFTQTCTETGLTDGKKCSVCGTTTKEQEIIPSAHSYESGACKNCGAVAPSSEGLEFELSSDGTCYAVIGVGTCSDKHIVIPSTYNNLPVTSIGESAFENIASLTSVEIPDSVTSIGTYAFCKCSHLTSVEIPDSVTSIENGVFSDCYSLTNVVIGENVTSIGIYAFYNCNSLASVVIPDGVTSIGDSAFWYCESLTSVVIPNSVTRIAYGGIHGSNCLTIYCEAPSQPSGWNSEWNLWNRPIVWDCKNNEIASDGNIYTVVDGLKYSIKGNVATVARQPKNINGDIVIPASISYKGVSYPVTSISDNAFAECLSLTSVVIQNGVTSIGAYAFQSCAELKSIVIPESVTSVGKHVFYDSMPKIYCEAESQPDGWDNNWNHSITRVTWGYKQES